MRVIVCYYPPGNTTYNGKVYPNEELADLFKSNLRTGVDMIVPEEFTLVTFEFDDEEKWKSE